jgi:hypothetical protein
MCGASLAGARPAGTRTHSAERGAAKQRPGAIRVVLFVVTFLVAVPIGLFAAFVALVLVTCQGASTDKNAVEMLVVSLLAFSLLSWFGITMLQPKE